jgi:hypothetical protein
VAPAPSGAKPSLAAAREGIAAAIGSGDLAEATRLLAGVSDEGLATPEMRQLREQIERRMLEREATRRGAREPDAEGHAWADSQLKKLLAPETSPRGAEARSAPVDGTSREPIEAVASTAPISTAGSLDEPARLALESGIAEADRLLRLGDTDGAADLLASIEMHNAVWEMPAGLQLRYRSLDDEARALRVAVRLARAERALAQGATVDALYELDAARALDRGHPAIPALAERVRLARQDSYANYRPPESAPARPRWVAPALAGLGAALVLLLLWRLLS